MFTNWRLLECSWAPLSYSLPIVAKLLYCCLCLFDAIIKVHVVYEKMFNENIIGKWKWISYVIKVYFIHDLYLVYIVETFIILN